MSCSFSSQDLEALVRDELSDVRAAKVAAHIADCDTCADEEQWLRLELAAFDARRQDAASADDLWAGVEAAIGVEAAVGKEEELVEPQRDRNAGSAKVLWFGSGFVVAAAAAAAMFVFVVPTQTTTPAPRVITKVVERSVPPTPTLVRVAGMDAIQKAEQQYITAAESLKAQYRLRHGRLNPALVRAYDKAMNENLLRLRAASSAAGHDMNGRVRVLDAYSSYVSTLQIAVEGTEI